MRAPRSAFLTATALRAPSLSTQPAHRRLCTAPHALQQPPAHSSAHTFQISAAEAGIRVDKLLASRFSSRSRSYLQSLIRDGHVLIDGLSPVSKSQRVTCGETVAVRLVPTYSDLPVTAEHVALQVLYEDEHLAFINKPAGMVTHPAPGNWQGTLVNALAARYESIREMGCQRAGIVHRLDKGTSGIMVIAKTQLAHDKLGALFAARAVQKEYIAITVNDACAEGCVSTTIEQPIGRHPTNRLKMSVLPLSQGGRSAKTIVQTIAHDAQGFLHLARVRIETGRTHQIRVHLRHARAPVLGDELYGATDVNARFGAGVNRAMLHSWRLQFTHPLTNERLCKSAPLPSDMHTLIARRMGADALADVHH